MNDYTVVKNEPFIRMVLNYLGLVIAYQELEKPEKFLLIKVQRLNKKQVNIVFKSVSEWEDEDKEGIYLKTDVALLMILLDTEKYLPFDMYEVVTNMRND